MNDINNDKEFQELIEQDKIMEKRLIRDVEKFVLDDLTNKYKLDSIIVALGSMTKRLMSKLEEIYPEEGEEIRESMGIFISTPPSEDDFE